MGILLETARPNRRYLLTLAGIRFAVCLLASVGAGVWITHAKAAPIGWLVGTGIFLSLALVFFVMGLAPLRLLTRAFEMYEDGFEAHDQQVLLAELEQLHWRRRVLRIAGCIPTSLSYLELTCVCKPKPAAKPTTRKRHGKTFVFSELMFIDLFDRFEAAYENSLPSTYDIASLKLKRKKPPTPSATETETKATGKNL